MLLNGLKLHIYVSPSTLDRACPLDTLTELEIQIGHTRRKMLNKSAWDQDIQSY